jgi:hypothetical protein
MKKQNYKDHKDEHVGMEKAMHDGNAHYRNEVSKPKQPKMAGDGYMYSAKDFKGQAMDTAYGQGGKKGCESDHKKIMAQMAPGYSDNEGHY